MSNMKENCEFGLEDTNINGLLSLILKTIMGSVIPLIPIPPQLLYFGAKLRGGMVASKITERALNEMSDAGIPVGEINGADNLTSIMTKAIVGSMTHSIKTEAQVQLAQGPGDLNIRAIGVNSGGPIIVDGYNTSFSNSHGTVS